MADTETKSLDALCGICRRVGSRAPLWTQGAGGNVSLKWADLLLVKSSGRRLDAVTPTAGIARVKRALLTALPQELEPLAPAAAEVAYAEKLRASARTPERPSPERPSMETGFHALLPGRWVGHFHSLAAILMGEIHEGAEGKLLEWLRSMAKRRVVVVPPVMPGWELSRAALATADAEIFLLANHGVILQTSENSIAALLDEWSELETKFCDEWGFKRLSALYRETDPLSAARKIEARLPAVTAKVFFPDAAVFHERLSRLTMASWDTDPDAAEIGLAIKLLAEALPTLRELPERIARNVAGLPTETFRRNV